MTIVDALAAVVGAVLGWANGWTKAWLRSLRRSSIAGRRAPPPEGGPAQ